MKSLRLFFVASLVFTKPLAAQDRAAPWSTVTFTANHEERGQAVVKLSGQEVLKEITISIGGNTLSVPAAEMEDIELPELHSANLLFGEDWYGPIKEDQEKTPHLIIELYFSEPSKFGSHPTVSFLFYEGKYQERILLEQETASDWIEYRKRPGEQEKETGKIVRPPAGGVLVPDAEE